MVQRLIQYLVSKYLAPNPSGFRTYEDGETQIYRGEGAVILCFLEQEYPIQDMKLIELLERHKLQQERN
jgi:hypothetical protein